MGIRPESVVDAMTATTVPWRTVPNHAPPLVVNDGGRAAAGYVGRTGDCGVRALAIAVFSADPSTDFVCASGRPTESARAYERAVDLVLRYAKTERKKRRKSAAASRSGTRTGIYGATMRRIMADPEVAALGWRWRSTMAIGGGCTTHLRADELPSGRLIVVVSKHFTTMIDGVIHDTYDPSRGGGRCVYGFWYQERDSQ